MARSLPPGNSFAAIASLMPSLNNSPELWNLRSDPFAFIAASMFVATTATTLPSMEHWSPERAQNMPRFPIYLVNSHHQPHLPLPPRTLPPHPPDLTARRPPF